MPLTKKQERIVKLASVGGTDKELLLLEEIFAMEERINEMEARHKEEMTGMKEMMTEIKTGIPQFGELIESIKTLAEKEIPAPPAPIINIPETKIEVKAPIVNIQPANIQVSAPNVSVPPPIVNVNSETKRVEIDETTKQAILDLQDSFEDLKKDHAKLKEQRPTIFGPGKTKIIRVDLSNQLNGVTTTFNLGMSHFGIISVNSSSSPFGAFRETIDYNEVGRTIVFTNAIDPAISLAEGQSLIIKVLK